MSGHNKWSTIKHKKAAADAKKGVAVSAYEGPYDATKDCDLDALGHLLGEQRVGIGDAGFFQYIRIRRVAEHTGGVQGIVDPADQVRVLVDNSDIVVFKGQVAGDVESDLPGAANNHFHGFKTFVVVNIAIACLRYVRPRI